ncbi:MAG: DUF5715 family protein [Acidobacteriota bacterium]
MGKIKRHSAPLLITLVFVVITGLLILPGLRKRGRHSYTSYLPTPLTAQAAEVNPWTQAVTMVKEDRGEPTGKQAKVDIPQQLRHYSDTRRFLAVQVAEVRQHGVQTPEDLVDLGEMIKGGEMVTLEPVTENYILFGVGGGAGKEPFTRYENGKSVPLFSESGLRQEYARIAESRVGSENEIAGLKKELSTLTRRERSKRTGLQGQIAAREKVVKAAVEHKAFLDRYYGDAETKTQLFGNYESLVSLGKSLPGRDFNIEEATARRDLKVRLLSSMRPEALKVMQEISVAYREKFNRPLPITSLVRPDEYQLQLSKTNPNATRIETPPHSTGLAFDIYYRYMTAAEQAHVMSHLARLKDEGRIEVLRENRDHYHVFAFVDGVRPTETFINASLSNTAKPKAVQETDRPTVASKSKKNPATVKKQKASKKRR